MSRSQASYSKKVIEHFKHPKNVGSIENADGIGKSSNGRTVFIELHIKVQDEIIVDAKFKTFGCGAAIAASSMVTELILGKRITEALNITDSTIFEALDGLPLEKEHCLALAEKALKTAIADYHGRKGV
ncbi:MAG: iron-sulfur cluster assembly scaffold protein [Dehalococcoidales bacterium]|nr:MAG: iron-sulfur cluster assembly scaffold protein [Dehalococcoidales bacterium]